MAEAFDSSLPLATIGDEQHVGEVKHETGGAMTHAELSWVKPGNRKHASWDNTILGRLVVDPGELVADVNSSRRANRLIRELRTRLRDGAELRDRGRARARGTEDEPETSDDDFEAPELQALNEEMTRRHWAEWFDVRVPALGNTTPRQAARR